MPGANTTLQTLQNFITYGCKKFYNIGPSSCPFVGLVVSSKVSLLSLATMPDQAKKASLEQMFMIIGDNEMFDKIDTDFDGECNQKFNLDWLSIFNCSEFGIPNTTNPAP